MAEHKATKSAGDSTVPKGAILAAKGAFVVPAGAAIADTVNLLTIPAGATLLGMMIAADGGTATMTITVGDGTTADKWGTVSDATAAFAHAGTVTGDLLAADTDVILTTGVAAMTEGDTYRGVAWYVM